MKKQNYMSWDTYFMGVSILSSFRSKNPTSQNGACIVESKHNKIVGMGYNGLPRGLKDNEDHYWNENKDPLISHHVYVIHAEENAIINSPSEKLEGAKMYLTQFPCNKCAQTIIQVGIKKVIYLIKEEHNDKHQKLNKAVTKMFADSDVEAISYDSLEKEDKKFIQDLIKLNKNYYG